MKALLLILFCVFVDLPAHNMQVAIFTITQKSEMLNLEINVERDDFLKVVSVPQGEAREDAYQSYLDKHLNIQINGQAFPLQIDGVEQRKQHIVLQCQGENLPVQIDEIDIENTFLQDVKGHSNVIEIRLQNQERDFLMNEERTQIEVLL